MGIYYTAMIENDEVSSFKSSVGPAWYNLTDHVFPEFDVGEYEFDFRGQKQELRKRLASALILNEEERIFEALEEFTAFIQTAIEKGATRLSIG